MGGFCGIYNFERERSASQSDIERMAQKMVFRQGIEAEQFVYRNMAAALVQSHRKRVERPSPGEPGELVLGFDGEPIAWPPKFLIEQYREKGTSCFSQIDGSFSIVILNPIEDSLVLARDPFGGKPLYYIESSSGIVFSTEIRALLCITSARPAVNIDCLREYLAFRYVAGNSTLFRDIQRILPGHFVFWRGRERRNIEYWSPVDGFRAGTRLSHSLDDCVAEAESLLKGAIRKRIGNSPRVAANCSGGIDSGLITSIAGTILSPGGLETFTVGFREKDWDETYHAGLTAMNTGARHHSITVESKDFSKELVNLNRWIEEPISDPNSVLLYILGAKVKEVGLHDIILTGEGADEVFLGYPRYNLLNIYSLLKKLPEFSNSLLGLVMSISGNRKIMKLKATLGIANPADAIIQNSAFVPEQALLEVLNPELPFDGYSYRKELLNGIQPNDLLLKTMVYDIKTYMVSSLSRLHAMNAPHGLMGSCPFADKDFFEFALAIPKKYKIGLLENKLLLRKLAMKYLPIENFRMPKSGFGVPLAHWFRTDKTLRMLINEMTLDTEMKRYFNIAIVNKYIKEHLEGRKDHCEYLWLNLNYFIWHKIFIK